MTTAVPGSAKLEIVDANRDFVVAVNRQILMIHCREKTPAGCLPPLRRGVVLAAKAGPPIFVVLIEVQSTEPDSHTRKLLADFWRDNGSGQQFATFIIIYRGEGFRGAMVRAVIQSMDFLVRLSYPRHVVKSFEEAGTLVRKYAPEITGASALATLNELTGVKAPAQ